MPDNLLRPAIRSPLRGAIRHPLSKGAGGAQITAPTIAIVDAADNPPSFDVGLGSGLGAPYDTAAGDYIELWIDGVLDATSDALSSGDIIAGTIEIPNGTLTNGAHYATARIKRSDGLGGYIYSGFSARDDFTTIILADLTLSASTIAENTAQGTTIGTLSGMIAGSSLSLQDSSGNQVQLIGSNVQTGSVAFDYETETTPTITVRETLAGATNTPHDTVLGLTVTDVSEYTEVGVRFDGSGDRLTFGPLTGAADAKTGLLFFSVVWRDAIGTEARWISTGSIFVNRSTLGKAVLVWVDTSNNQNIVISSTTAVAVDERANYLVGLNADGTSVIYTQTSGGGWVLDGSDATGGGVDLDFTWTSLTLGARDNASKYVNGDVYRLAMWTGITLPDLSNAAVRAKFADVTTLVTVDPSVSVAAYGTPILDMYGAASVWNAGTNHGFGGNGTMTGGVV